MALYTWLIHSYSFIKQPGLIPCSNPWYFFSMTLTSYHFNKEKRHQLILETRHDSWCKIFNLFETATAVSGLVSLLHAVNWPSTKAGLRISFTWDRKDSLSQTTADFAANCPSLSHLISDNSKLFSQGDPAYPRQQQTLKFPKKLLQIVLNSCTLSQRLELFGTTCHKDLWYIGEF